MRQQNSNGGRRPRGRTNNRKQHGGGQGRSGTYDSNGPDGRIRGNASQVYEKYIGLARDATSASDRIAAEAYYQHAEHYYRIVNDSTDPESPGSQRAHGTQSGQAQQANGDVDGNQAVPQNAHAGRNQQDRQERSNRHQDRRSRGPARDDTEVPGLEPQPDIALGNTPAAADRGSQNELPLEGREGQRRSRGGRFGDRNRLRSAESSTETVGRAESQPKGEQATPKAASARKLEAEPSLEDSIPAAIVPLDAAADETPAPRRRGRPRKRPVEEPKEAVSADGAANGAAPTEDTAEAAPVAAPKRRGRPRKVVAEAAPAAENEDSGAEGSSAANA